MHFRITNTFTDSLVKLTNEEENAMKTPVLDLQMNTINSGGAQIVEVRETVREIEVPQYVAPEEAETESAPGQ